jgi:hypothetical protein
MPEERTDEPERGAETEDAGASLPEIDFSTFIVSLAHSALINLGMVEDPSTSERTEPNLGAARQTIDILGLLQEKTRGNLDETESHRLESLLYELRMHYVECSKKKPRE